ncbi:MAG: type II toxin-antitoxin system HicA family toxin [Armatimonadetes bacterium CG_4_10_14_3_um_filter_66_18]|nr:type II toxin-antitoxin system HicA family toxin [Armatimonadota bacterium]OIP03866.1 MAG: hypothetical protein AUJ96_14000 [Armatimonadetes bacterium CG2_30_66_41]PIU87984.1 MAG: type II toxin-antitoxin system HicA family toxin [Armatimonadetes bacterium CG06_land_8_20_14_3_00_66_21]PIW17385.1 MAG: type II toxin-antitoxin system HicA family toxin [Armatimonadetes bacterium CG17_big_fil_post_rev_8_21_14_2_50_66_6]PIX39396.1 MAG: type II toxin-antitoxin system HicA family toxin [Armatimonadet
MPKLSPVSRRELVRRLRALGFEGPYPGGKHEWMRRNAVRITVPNPHEGDLDPALIRRMLRRAGISQSEWLGV